MTKLTLPFLETMITQACNLSCTGCTNYSDLTHQGYVPWSHGRTQLENWLDRIEIEEFGIIGGEPMINPEWKDWIAGVRQLLPQARIRFTTNGLLLKKQSGVLDFLEAVGNVTFKITVHVHDRTLENQIQHIFQARDWQPVTEFGIRRWAGPHGTRLQINRPDRFIKTYQGTYKDMQPWDSDPAAAFESCCQQTCPLLYQGRIYKCSTAGLLVNTLNRFDRPNWNSWQKYIDSGIGINDDNDTVKRFVDNFGKMNSICGQCPSSLHHTSILNHTITVGRK